MFLITIGRSRLRSGKSARDQTLSESELRMLAKALSESRVRVVRLKSAEIVFPIVKPAFTSSWISSGNFILVSPSGVVATSEGDGSRAWDFRF